ncbi:MULTISPECIES: oligopeptide ABC transporter substrate-binding protein [unclassified Lactobacillus]|uniref:oligopeptide ABC transporter substrate-binding protein n=1 Tax=unclassified Lactobacillus TaxID=2620435 RepID=UPI000EFA9175|nr:MULTISPECIES: oligopeptide ABC transporter substrate-binding protein [unclassified Lactobacillus]RMC39171.1 oligopeptide ABC transporter substrate-binding protein [Lactobacillus sp. ESL0237]RMC43454.1 oligopeptide ABC transporter substrate-binding protein [Lactobacillus sp. ESL0234]RMC44367.1 oligopeptide ABC transporter substrate-binding protein [Lactobacillus sp. ESL0236]RMC46803.1 oligopeptide ABC transporter substrate-binding protein [Lactobacillus sp. ESL0230]
MKRENILASLGILSMAAMTLAGCGKNNATKNETKTVAKFPVETPIKTPKQGGVVKIAVETDTPFSGIFSNELSSEDVDAQVGAPGQETLFDSDDHYKINDKGPATLKLNLKNNTATINIKKGVKWSDGKQVVAKDYEYAYEILANKETMCPRYTNQFEILKGLKEYHEGKAKNISGIEMPDGENGRKIVLHFSHLSPTMYNAGNRYLWSSVEPYHYLKNIPFSKLKSSDQIRKNPLFFGAFKLAKLVRGQSATWVPNEHYWRGKPKLDKIVISVVSPNSATQAIKSHKFDVIQVINTQWDQVKNTKDVNFVAQIPLSYRYLGFKVGKWDNKLNRNVENPNAKMNNKALRQAIGYAMNVDEVNKHYTSSLSFRVTTLIPSKFGDFFDKDAKGFPYSLKKANDILDKAGFKKKGKWRTQPNGKPLTIKIAAMSGDATQEPITQNYIQQWKKIGLNVQLATGRLIEHNSFYDKLQHDDKGIDMYIGGWSMPSEPSPQSYYSESAPFNMGRFVTAKNTKLLEDMNSQKAFNHKYRVQKFHEWQRYMNEEAYYIPIYNSYQITAVNNQITGYSFKPSKNNSGQPLWYNVGYVK